MPIISVTNLRKPYGNHVVLRDASLDPATNPARLREIVGMQLQECRLPAKTTVTEALELYRSFYRAPREAGELLERFGLAEHRAQRFGSLSGGQQQRLSVALALVGNPRMAILDELTTGLDPHARRDIWTFLDELRAGGVTIVLVTHFMEEAQRLCDRVAVIDDGASPRFACASRARTSTTPTSRSPPHRRTRHDRHHRHLETCSAGPLGGRRHECSAALRGPAVAQRARPAHLGRGAAARRHGGPGERSLDPRALRESRRPELQPGLPAHPHHLHRLPALAADAGGAAGEVSGGRHPHACARPPRRPRTCWSPSSC